jgi:hypothetical protein
VSASPELFEDVAFASTTLRSSRERARVRAIAAVRGMEQALVDALEGETLKGLREVVPGYYAARARYTGKKDTYLPFEPLPDPKSGADYGREVLVVTASGVLEMARAVRHGHGVFGAESRVAADVDLVIEDVEHLGRLFPRLLAEHIERSRRTSMRFMRLEDVAQRISAALVA